MPPCLPRDHLKFLMLKPEREHGVHCQVDMSTEMLFLSSLGTERYNGKDFQKNCGREDELGS